MVTKEIHGERVLILGFGREGQSTAAFLAKHVSGLSVAVADRKHGKDYLEHIETFDTVIRSPGISVRTPALARYQKHGGWVTSATNIFFSLCPGVTIGVTGTKGKSTTASLIAHILKHATSGIKATQIPGISKDVRLAGNIGRPMLDYLEGATGDTVFVLELSSHQLEDIRYSPHVAVVLNIVPEHLDYYPDFDAYRNAKAHIVTFQEKTDVVLYHPNAADIARCSVGRKIVIPTLPNTPTKLSGNKDNIAAALSVASLFGIDTKRAEAAVAEFSALPHRLEFVGEFGGIRFYNDSLATIPQATIHGLEALGGQVATLIAGGYDRGVDMSVLGEYLVKHPVKTLILFPDTGAKIWDAIRRARRGTAGPKTKKFGVTTMKEATELAYKHTPRGAICLLSPAAASFNTFKDYADRGEQFMSWVKKLKR